jgi:ubiquinone/menaquinone biosynthesis C-methylase UbiE
MRPGGRLAIYDLYKPRNPFFRFFLYTFFYYVVEQRVMHIYTPEGWKMLLDTVGFRLENVEAHYGLSALVTAVK